MNGIFVTNKYFISNSFIKIKEDFLNSAKKLNINLTPYNNIELIKILSSKSFNKPDFVLFWDKDVKLAKYLESIGVRVFNSSESIRICDDKSLTYLNLINKDIKMPKTVFSPLIYYHDISKDDEFVSYVLDTFSFPFIFKECFGSFGQQVYMINSEQELRDRISKCGTWPFIIQEFIKESFGNDLRIYLVGDKIIGAMKRENKSGDFRANVELGGEASEYTINDAEANLAHKVKKELKLDFCGVDILFGKDNEPILCEVNSNAYFVSFNKVLKLDVSEYILSYIKNTI